MKVIGQIIEYLHARGRLTRRELAYLENEGFLRTTVDEYEYDQYFPLYIDPYERDPLLDQEDAEEAKHRLHQRRSRPQPPKSALKAVEIRDLIAQRRPGWAEVLSPLVSLARRLSPAATLETAPLLLRDADDARLLAAMVAEIKATADWLETLWEALQFEEYRACCGRGGEADKAYRVILAGRNVSEITKYAWILRHPEIAWVHTLITVQRRIMRMCGVLFETQFPLIDSYLAQTYRSKALWAFILLYSAQRYASDLHPNLLPQECVLRAETLPDPACFAAAWEFALEMRREEVLPFMVSAFGIEDPAEARAKQSTKKGRVPLLCAARWYKPY